MSLGRFARWRKGCETKREKCKNCQTDSTRRMANTCEGQDKERVAGGSGELTQSGGSRNKRHGESGERLRMTWIRTRSHLPIFSLLFEAKAPQRPP